MSPRGRKRLNLDQETKKLFMKERQKSASQCYRIRKKVEHERLFRKYSQLVTQNNELKKTINDLLVKCISVRRLLSEIRQLKTTKTKQTQNKRK